MGGAIPLLDWGSEAQKKEFLPKIAVGEQIMDAGHDRAVRPALTPRACEMEAKAEGDKFVLNGTKLFIRDSHVADYMTVAVRTKQGRQG